jgi:hypothetical protein
MDKFLICKKDAKAPPAPDTKVLDADLPQKNVKAPPAYDGSPSLLEDDDSSASSLSTSESIWEEGFHLRVIP